MLQASTRKQIADFWTNQNLEIETLMSQSLFLFVHTGVLVASHANKFTYERKDE